MKAVMYHYVRPEPEHLPYFRYLHLEDFRRQLDWLDETYGFVSRDDFETALISRRPVSGAVLTFDDGIHDHYHHVFPELRRRGLWGIFYVPTGIYQTRTLLDVHRIHMLIGRHGGLAALDALRAIVEDHMLVDKNNVAFRSSTYRFQDNDEATNEVKRVLNYYISYEHRADVLTEVMAALDGHRDTGFEGFYLTREQMREMAQGGMVIGSHSVSHPVFSKLDVDTQWLEIDQSFSFLEDVLDAPVDTFCYPYGGFHNFTDDTRHLLNKRGCRFAFNVEPRDIEARDLTDEPMALPRYDCNMFQHGKASMGSRHGQTHLYSKSDTT